MARPLRGSVPAGFYHVTRRSAGATPMFRDDFDRTDFCRRLVSVMKEYEWRLHAFCLMPTHYHGLLEVGENRLQDGMHDLSGGYAQEFNQRWGRTGHLKGSPYGAKPIAGDAHLLQTVKYIAWNPVEAGLCKHPAEWVWGSYRGAAGYDSGFTFVTNDFVLGCLHEDRAKAQRLLRIFVETL